MALQLHCLGGNMVASFIWILHPSFWSALRAPCLVLRHCLHHHRKMMATPLDWIMCWCLLMHNSGHIIMLEFPACHPAACHPNSPLPYLYDLLYPASSISRTSLAKQVNLSNIMVEVTQQPCTSFFLPNPDTHILRNQHPSLLSSWHTIRSLQWSNYLLEDIVVHIFSSLSFTFILWWIMESHGHHIFLYGE